MPASTRTRFTLAHANASARLPKRVMSAQTPTPTTQAFRKQPRRNAASASQPGRSTSKPNAHQPRRARSAKIAVPRTIPTSHEPSVRWRMPIGAMNWCFMDFDHTSSSTAYATSSWQTLTTDSAIVPTSTNEACSGVSRRNRVMSPMESTPTIGQNRSSKKKNTLREAMSAFRTSTASTARSSARQLNEDLLQLGLADLHVPHHHAPGAERAQQLGQALPGRVHRALREAAHSHAAEHARRLGQPRHVRRVEPQRDDFSQTDLALELAGGPAREDPPLLDERDLVAELLGLAHVVG